MTATEATPALLMPYVTCPECRHRGSDHPRRRDGADMECIGGYLGFAAIGDDGTTVSLSNRCPCERKRIG